MIKNPTSIGTTIYSDIRVIINKGDNSWSLGTGIRKEEGKEHYLIRWNGNDNDSGFPKSHNNGSWFQIPDEFKPFLDNLKTFASVLNQIIN